MPSLSSAELKDLPTSTLYGRLASIVVDSSDERATFSNWAKTFQCAPQTVFLPSTEDECVLIVELARREKQTVRCVGAGHSPSDLACTNGFMVRTDRLDDTIEVDTEKSVVEVGSGISLHALHRLLASHDLAMSNVGSISDQSIGGIITTATHGSGTSYPVISSSVLALTLINPTGQLVACSREENKDLFIATLCGLGTTGLIVRVRMQVEKAFRLDETVEPVEFEEFVDNFEEIGRSSEHTRAWWFPQARAFSVGRANRSYKPAEPDTSYASYLRGVVFGFHIIQFLLFVARYIPSFTPVVGRLAWKHVNGRKGRHIDDSYKVFNFDCLFAQYTTEWAIPADVAPACLREMQVWLEAEAADPNGIRIHFPIEVRWTKEDDIWLSPSTGRETVYIGVVQFRPYGLPTPYRRYFSRFVEIVTSYQGRPHWAKAHTLTPPELRTLYPEFDRFVALVQENDPEGMFRNEYVRRHLLGEKSEAVEDGVFRSSGRRGV